MSGVFAAVATCMQAMAPLTEAERGQVVDALCSLLPDDETEPDDDDTPCVPCEPIEPRRPVSVPVQTPSPKGGEYADRIVERLQDGPMTTTELLRALGLPAGGTDPRWRSSVSKAQRAGRVTCTRHGKVTIWRIGSRSDTAQ